MANAPNVELYESTGDTRHSANMHLAPECYTLPGPRLHTVPGSSSMYPEAYHVYDIRHPSQEAHQPFVQGQLPPSCNPYTLEHPGGQAPPLRPYTCPRHALKPYALSAGPHMSPPSTNKCTKGQRQQYNPEKPHGAETCLRVCGAVGHIGLTALHELCRLTSDAITSWTRPVWERNEDYPPYSAQSYHIGDYEYEVMVFRKPRSCCAKILRPS